MNEADPRSIARASFWLRECWRLSVARIRGFLPSGSPTTTRMHHPRRQSSRLSAGEEHQVDQLTGLALSFWRFGSNQNSCWRHPRTMPFQGRREGTRRRTRRRTRRPWEAHRATLRLRCYRALPVHYCFATIASRVRLRDNVCLHGRLLGTTAAAALCQVQTPRAGSKLPS